MNTLQLADIMKHNNYTRHYMHGNHLSCFCFNDGNARYVYALCSMNMSGQYTEAIATMDDGARKLIEHKQVRDCLLFHAMAGACMMCSTWLL